MNAVRKAPSADHRPAPAKGARKAKPAARKKARGPKVARSEAAPAASKGIRPGTKLETVVKMLTRPGGCTVKEVLKATEWPAISMPQQARAAGLKLFKEKRDGVTHYTAIKAKED